LLITQKELFHVLIRLATCLKKAEGSPEQEISQRVPRDRTGETEAAKCNGGKYTGHACSADIPTELDAMFTGVNGYVVHKLVEVTQPCVVKVTALFARGARISFCTKSASLKTTELCVYFEKTILCCAASENTTVLKGLPKKSREQGAALHGWPFSSARTKEWISSPRTT
jgi:hypothetical protein